MEQPEVLKTLIAIARDFQKSTTPPELEEQKQQINQMIDKAINIAENCLLINKPKYEEGQHVKGEKIDVSIDGVKVIKFEGEIKVLKPFDTIPPTEYKYIVLDNLSKDIITVRESQIKTGTTKYTLKLHEETDDLHNTD